MIHALRFIPLVTAIVLLIFFQQIVQVPQHVYSVAPAGVVLLGFALWLLTGRNIFSEKFWRFLTTPILFAAAGGLFLAFFQSLLLKQLLVVSIVVFLWVYLEVLYLWFHFRPRYQVHSLENISSYLDLLTIFFAASGFYGLTAFLGMPVWYFIVFFAIIAGLVTYQLIWTSGATVRSGLPYVLIITLVTTQLFGMVYLLPTSIYVDGFLVATIYYIMVGLSRNWLMGVRESGVVRRYLFIGVTSIFIILITAKWF